MNCLVNKIYVSSGDMSQSIVNLFFIISSDPNKTKRSLDIQDRMWNDVKEDR